MFEVIRYGRDKEQLHRIMEENREAYSSLDSDTREMLEVMANVKFSEEYSLVEREERYSMLKAFEDMRLEGKIEGKIEDILELLEEFGQVPQQIMETVKKESNPDILSKWHKSAARATSFAEFEASMHQ